MSIQILNSESFERAAYSLKHQMEHFSGSSPIAFDVERFERSVEVFRSSIDKMATVLGMQAENDQRKSIGASMAYTENDFVSA
jgi:hypothetical protein